MTPVEIVAAAVRTLRYADLKPTMRMPHAEDIIIAETVLTALHAAGWRIVKTDGDEHAGEDVQITDEWTPDD